MSQFGHVQPATDFCTFFIGTCLSVLVFPTHLALRLGLSCGTLHWAIRQTLRRWIAPCKVTLGTNLPPIRMLLTSPIREARRDAL